MSKVPASALCYGEGAGFCMAFYRDSDLCGLLLCERTALNRQGREAALMPREKQYRSGSAAVGGGMLVLWLAMRGTAWLEQEWLPLLPQTAAAAAGLLLQR